MRPNRYMAVLLFPVMTGFLLLSCAARQQPAAPTAIELLYSGRYAELSRLMSAVENRTAEEDALFSLATLLLRPVGTTATAEAARLGSTGKDGQSVRAATLLLELSHHIETSPSADFELLLCETALGAVGSGRFSAGTFTGDSGAPEYLRLGVAIIEQMNRQSQFLSGYSLPAERFRDVWNGAYLLLQDGLDQLSEYQAWRLFVCLAELSYRIRDDAGRSPLADTFFDTAILILKQYPVIAVAARCDLASPYEKLRASIATRRSPMAELERAVAAGSGCTRGQYAPVP